jgi:hypothetical protein
MPFENDELFEAQVGLPRETDPSAVGEVYRPEAVAPLIAVQHSDFFVGSGHKFRAEVVVLLFAVILLSALLAKQLHCSKIVTLTDHLLHKPY